TASANAGDVDVFLEDVFHLEFVDGLRAARNSAEIVAVRFEKLFGPFLGRCLSCCQQHQGQCDTKTAIHRRLLLEQPCAPNGSMWDNGCGMLVAGVGTILIAMRRSGGVRRNSTSRLR